MSISLPADDYYIVENVAGESGKLECKVYTDKGWVKFDNNNENLVDKATSVHVDEGKVIELATDGL